MIGFWLPGRQLRQTSDRISLRQLCYASFLVVLVTSFTAKTAFGGTNVSQDLPSPGSVGNVICNSDPSQSYAIYLPSAYTLARRWPIIYFFDPAGRGGRPLDLYKGIAEEYGFVFAGSNNSRNFSGDQSKILNAIWRDTHARFSLDERRVYASGFSGGARVAGAMARYCSGCQIEGVIAHGAGYFSGEGTSKDQLFYFFAIGNEDFNWPEVVTIRREREERSAPYRVRVFTGSHQWAPPAVMEDAVQWLQLKAMQAGDVPPDRQFIRQQFLQIQAEANAAEKANDPLGQLAAYRSAVADFAGLEDVKEWTGRLAELKASTGLKSALKAERDQVEEQLTLERGIAPKIYSYVSGSAPDLNRLRIEILQNMGGLKDQALHSKNENKRLVFQRALQDIWVEGIEEGQQELQSRHFGKAEACFDLMSQMRNDPWPVLLLAETHAAAGKPKEAIKDLKEAVRRGWKDSLAIETEPSLQSLKTVPDFQRLLIQMKDK